MKATQLSPIGWFLLCACAAGLLSSCGSTARTIVKHRGDRIEVCEGVRPWVEAAALSNTIDMKLIMGLIRVESHYNPSAISRAGARGLMQVMPATGKGQGCGDLLDPQENIRCGVLVLSLFLKRYNGKTVYGLAAYNGGYRYATKPWKEDRLPRNDAYVEKVLQAKSRYARGGCALLMEEF